MDWGGKLGLGKLDIQSLSQKAESFARKIKDDVEKTVDEALGIPEAKGGEGEERVNFWHNDGDGDGDGGDDGDGGGWDVDDDLDLGDADGAEEGGLPDPPAEENGVAAEEEVDADAPRQADVEEAASEAEAAPSTPTKTVVVRVPLPQPVEVMERGEGGGSPGAPDGEGSAGGPPSKVEPEQVEEAEAEQLAAPERNPEDPAPSPTQNDGLTKTTTTLLVVDPEEGDGEEVSRGAEWAKQVEAKLLEKSQQIADLMQESDDQKSLIQAQKKRIGELEGERKKLRQDKADRSNAMAKLRKKEKEVQEILEEGETLSKRQHEAEQQIKKLKGRVKELEAEQKKAADKGLSNVEEVHGKIVSLEAENGELRRSADALGEQMSSYQRRVQELQDLQSETEARALDKIEALRADLRESSLRLQEREAQYAEIAANVPEATKPLVDQVERLQHELASREETWSSAESALSLRAKDLEAKVRQYQAQEQAQERLLRDGADQIRALAQERDELSHRLREAEANDRSGSGDGAVGGGGSQGPGEEALRAAVARADQLQAQLLEEKWKRETLEIEVRRLGQDSDRKVRARAEALREAEAAAGRPREDAQAPAAAPPPEEEPNLPAANSFSGIRSLEELEVVANKLAEDLVLKSRQLSASQARLAELERGGEDLVATKRKLAMALELVGEKEEDIEHLYGDLADLKRLYREHVDELYAG